jgi:hypothetical protein
VKSKFKKEDFPFSFLDKRGSPPISLTKPSYHIVETSHHTTQQQTSKLNRFDQTTLQGFHTVHNKKQKNAGENELKTERETRALLLPTSTSSLDHLLHQMHILPSLLLPSFFLSFYSSTSSALASTTPSFSLLQTHLSQIFPTPLLRTPADP